MENTLKHLTGKFEGEPLLVPYFWDMVMNGFGDDTREIDGLLVERFEITKEDKENFPELSNHNYIDLWESENDFVFYDVDYKPGQGGNENEN